LTVWYKFTQNKMTEPASWVSRVWSLTQSANEYSDEKEIIADIVQQLRNGIIKTDNDITDELIGLLIKKYSKGLRNMCVMCGIDLGEMNPRQLCGKTQCFNIF